MPSASTVAEPGVLSAPGKTSLFCPEIDEATALPMAGRADMQPAPFIFENATRRPFKPQTATLM